MRCIASCGILLFALMQLGWSRAQERSIFTAANDPLPFQVDATVPDPDDAQNASDPAQAASEKLTIVWTSGDPEVAHRMVLMYGNAAKSNQWFDEVHLIIWGPSARLVAADKDIQAKLKEMKQNGVTLDACVVCADSYGVSDRLRELGIEVRPMGKPLSNIIREKDGHLITF